MEMMLFWEKRSKIIENKLQFCLCGKKTISIFAPAFERNTSS